MVKLPVEPAVKTVGLLIVTLFVEEMSEALPVVVAPKVMVPVALVVMTPPAELKVKFPGPRLLKVIAAPALVMIEPAEVVAVTLPVDAAEETIVAPMAMLPVVAVRVIEPPLVSSKGPWMLMAVVAAVCVVTSMAKSPAPVVEIIDGLIAVVIAPADP